MGWYFIPRPEHGKATLSPLHTDNDHDATHDGELMGYCNENHRQSNPDDDNLRRRLLDVHGPPAGAGKREEANCSL